MFPWHTLPANLQGFDWVGGGEMGFLLVRVLDASLIDLPIGVDVARKNYCSD